MNLSRVLTYCYYLSCRTQWGVPKIHVLSVIASRDGLMKLAEEQPDICITVGTIDDKLDEHGQVLPGLGDAGDRLFGTDAIDDEEALLHPSKRRKFSIDE